MAETGLTVHRARQVGAWTVVAVTGEIDFTTADTLYAHGHRLLADGSGHLILDFAAVTFCDSSGMSALIGLMREARLRNGILALAGAPGRVRRALHQIGLHRFIPVYPDVEAAVAAAMLPPQGGDQQAK
ncbi:STAS domain-containing protein [Streptomyces chrestomyceticus]|uniref:STAS domain-containing protein n=1 Tax=Streptomyces chrestomyceticus TaxID=68185 RepID=UPI0037BDEC4A